MKKINIIESIIFIIGIIIELIIFAYGVVHQRSDEWHNTVFIFFTNIYVIYFGVIYFINKFIASNKD